MGELTIIAALFVEKFGIYSTLMGLELWDTQRDARRYPGPHPVVAHPPCQLWVNFAALNFKRYGGEHNRPGNDGGCFASALNSVLTWGGLLEHPAGSNAWKAFNLIAPSKGAEWLRGPGYWVTEVWQSAYGHKARKRTWLLYSGKREPLPMNWNRLAGSHQVGWFDRIKPTLSKREASATPLEFAEALIELAEWSLGET